MKEKFILMLLALAVAGVPLALRKPSAVIPAQGVDVLVVVTPHQESIRNEFERAFRAHWRAKTGRDAAIDWRLPGGATDIARFVNSEFTNSFRNYWTNELKRPWSAAVEQGFANARLDGASPPANADAAEREAFAQAQEARTAFLQSDAGIGLDVFFGGGSYEFTQQAARGQIVPSGVEQRHPEWFTEEVIPLEFSGETLRDARGRWQGAVLSTFGLVFNRDRLRAANFSGEPGAWGDLALPQFAGAVALADPMQSGSNAKIYEMILQQQMQVQLRELTAQGLPADTATPRAIAAGWLSGLQLAQLAAANSSYFTDSAGKVVLDVAAGDCAIGMAVDFYGRMEEEALAERNPDDSARADRFGFTMPRGGTSLSSDPIALFRGAKNPELAHAFIDFVLSLEGQKLWDFRAGTPGGPARTALRRSPIRRDLYTAAWRPYMADPDVRPYDETEDFVYHAAWTSPLFSEMRFIIKAAFIDPQPELQSVWAAIRRARAAGREANAAAALEKMQDLGAVDFAAASGGIKAALAAGPVARMKLEAELNEHFRAQYRAARALVESGALSSQTK